MTAAVLLVGVASWLAAWWTGPRERPLLVVVTAHDIQERQKLQEADLSFEVRREKPARQPVLRPQDAVGQCTGTALAAERLVGWQQLSLPRPGDSSCGNARATLDVLNKAIGASLKRQNSDDRKPTATSDRAAQVPRDADAATDARTALDAVSRFLVNLADARDAYGLNADAAIIDFGNEITKNLAKRRGEKAADALAGSSCHEESKHKAGKTDPKPDGADSVSPR